MIRRKRRGFTLVEVTLAIVIGIIMIAGATLIYNQAKNSAGNSRAQAKVVSLQQLVEEYAAQNQGLYPDQLGNVQALWTRKRPDDWNKSPWGGLIGSAFSPSSLTGAGVGSWTAATTISSASLGAGGGATTAIPSSPAAVLTGTTINTFAGALVYDYNRDNASWSYGGDIMTNTSVGVRGYGVFIADQQGRWPNFIAGGKQ